MTSTDQERWQQVKKRLRVELGEDIFTSWFARMELETIDKGAIRLSVPTRFLRNWIQSHYSERVLGHWQAEDSDHHPFGTERPLGRDPSAARSSRSAPNRPRRRANCARYRATASRCAPACRS